MAPMEMHHAMNGSGAGGTALRLGLLVAVLLATAVHVWSERRRPAGSASGWRPLWGHGLMGVAMTSMLLPETWRTLPPAAWEPVFLAVGVLGTGGAVRRWRAGDGGGARHDAELVVGAVAMVAMCRGWALDPRLVGLLAVYFVLQALAVGAAGLGRAALTAVMAYMLVAH